MTERVQELEAAGDDALDRALDLGIDRAVLNNLVSRVVRFMLFRNYEKPEVPVKQQDLANLWQKEQQIGRHARKLPGIVVPMAAAKLATTFGLEMRELGGVHKPAAAAAATASQAGAAAAADAGTAVAGGSGMAASGNGAASSQKMFVLRSMLPQALVQKFVQDPADDPVRGLMTVILALIQLSEGSMEADALWRDLRKMGVDKDGSANCFGKKGAAGVVANMKKSRCEGGTCTDTVGGAVSVTCICLNCTYLPMAGWVCCGMVSLPWTGAAWNSNNGSRPLTTLHAVVHPPTHKMATICMLMTGAGCTLQLSPPFRPSMEWMLHVAVSCRYIASKKRVTPAGEQQLLYVWGENATDEFGGSMNVFIDRVRDTGAS
eukprot:GHRR01026291.1.p1 GENE.GHRR01026291.1~~GHRR01026291.1.p1  ORF type:complete len:437 (+),score=151.11 GHRR01026291.1:185-1312(+)